MDTIVTEKAAANLLKLAPQTLRAWRHKRQGPDYVKFGRAIRYCVNDLAAFVEKRRVSPGGTRKRDRKREEADGCVSVQ